MKMRRKERARTATADFFFGFDLVVTNFWRLELANAGFLRQSTLDKLAFGVIRLLNRKAG
jgi:hypothetical protein